LYEVFYIFVSAMWWQGLGRSISEQKPLRMEVTQIKFIQP